MEEWRVYGRFPEYEASSLGRVRRRDTGRIMDPLPDLGGYLKVRLSSPSTGECKLIPIHRVVAEVFCEPPRLVVNHRNGDKLDNRPGNLEWCTPGENTRHAHRSGLIGGTYGEGARWSKLTDQKVRSCRERFKSGSGTIKGMAREHGVSAKTMRFAVKGRTWRHLKPPGPTEVSLEGPWDAVPDMEP